MCAEVPQRATENSDGHDGNFKCLSEAQYLLGTDQTEEQFEV